MKKIIILSLLFLSSCTKYVPFSQKIREDLESQNVDFSKVQFGIKDKIILKRNVLKTTKEVNQGEYKKESLLIRNNVAFEGKRSKVLTGLCKDKKPKVLAIYFENGDLQNKRVPFRLTDKGEYVFYEESKTLFYDGEMYGISQGQWIKLYINNVEIKKEKEVSRKVSGLKVN